MTALDIAWLAGIVEGEGSIKFTRGSPSIIVSMTDEDVIVRVANIWRVRVSGPYKPHGKRTKDVWTVGVHGYTAIGWLMTLYRFFGLRRRQAAWQAIAQWNAAPGHARKVRGQDGKTLPAVCHPDRPLHARQKCRQCYGQEYMKSWRTKTGRNGTYYRQLRSA